MRLGIGVASILVTSAASGGLGAQSLPPDSVYQRLLDFPQMVKGGRITPDWAADGKSLRYEVGGRRFEVELAGNTLRELPQSTKPASRVAPSEAPSPDGRSVAFVEGWNVWLRSLSDERTTALTSDGVAGNGWTREPFYTRSVPLLWAPDSRSLLAVVADFRKLNRTIVVRWENQRAESTVATPYPLPGGAVEQARICRLGAADPSRVCFDTGPEPDQILYPIDWRVNGSEAFLLRFDRFMKRLDLLAGNPTNGATRIVVRDSQPTFIEGVGVLRETLLYPLRDDRRLIWRSERDGWSHLYLYDVQGNLLGRITEGRFRVDRVVAVDERAGIVYFAGRAEPNRPYDIHLYRIGLDGRGMRRLTEGSGEHEVSFAPDLTTFVDVHSDVGRPPASDLRRASDGRLIRILDRADISALTEIGWRAPETFVVKAADGVTDLHGALYLPTSFDPAKRYAVIDNQYMGNIRQAVPHHFVGSYPGDESYALAQRGFVVFMVDGRGTLGRDKAFHDATYMKLGSFEVADHIAALRQVSATRPWMDTSRVGITGFSWGGYYTLRAMLTAPEVFKVGVSGAPVVDLDGRANRIEPYMGTPEQNPDGYARASNVLLADRLRGRLMIAVGTSDTNVTMSHPIRMIDALERAGKHFNFVLLPGEAHNLSARAQRYYVEARARFFLEYLQP